MGDLGGRVESSGNYLFNNVENKSDMGPFLGPGMFFSVDSCCFEERKAGFPELWEWDRAYRWVTLILRFDGIYTFLFNCVS